MTRNILARRIVGATIAAVGALTLATVISSPAAALNTFPPSDCVTDCVVTLGTPSAAETFAVPSGITDLSVTVSGGAGAQPPAFTAFLGAAASNGGVTTVDLGTTYAGQTLTLGVGDIGQGSYVQQGSNLLVVAGGGGGAGYVGRLDQPGQYWSTQAGGDGSSPTATGITSGADSTVYGGSSANGKGGTNLGGPGGTGSGAFFANGVAGGSTTTTTGAGSTLAAGGAGPTASINGDTQVSGSGGSGYTGGGSGGRTHTTDGDGNPVDVVGGGGGGAGFLATGLTGTAGTPNTGPGSVALTYSFSPTITTTATTVHRGDNVPVTITGLPANTDFTVTFDGGTVVTDTSDSTGAATESFIVDSAAASGHFPLGLVVGGASVATSDPVAVIITLATTGGPSPELPAMAAMLLILAGAGVVVGRRRRPVIS